MTITFALLIERVFAVCYAILGLSLLAYAARWRDWAQSLRADPNMGLRYGAIPLVMGAVIVSGHDHWVADLTVIVTIAGWLALVKGMLCFLAPEVMHRLMQRFPISYGLILVSGLAWLVLALLVGWKAFLWRAA